MDTRYNTRTKVIEKLNITPSNLKEINHDQHNKRHNKQKLIISLLIIFLLLLHLTGFRIIFVTGTSMTPTLKPNSLCIAKKCNLSTLNKQDIIVLTDKIRGGYIIKRLIALPKDNIQINGENYTLKDNEIYIVGDNRENSYDSRHYGAITLNNHQVYKVIQLKSP